jgi:hypothetical protein
VRTQEEIIDGIEKNVLTMNMLMKGMLRRNTELEAENAALWAFVRAWDVTDEILVANGLFATIDVDVAVVKARDTLRQYEEDT